MDSEQARDIVAQFRESHHAVARMLAAGMTPSMIRQRTGRSQRSLSLLMADPTFQELIAYYTKRIEDKWEENMDSYLDLGMSNMIRAEAQIAERLEAAEENDEPIPLMTLDRISQGRADRFGYGKNQRIDVNVNFADKLDRAIERSKTIEAQVSPSALPAPRAEQVIVRPDAEPARQPMPYEQPRRAFAQVLKRRKVA